LFFLARDPWQGYYVLVIRWFRKRGTGTVAGDRICSGIFIEATEPVPFFLLRGYYFLVIRSV